jgi:hypothetical protein
LYRALRDSLKFALEKSLFCSAGACHVFCPFRVNKNNSLLLQLILRLIQSMNEVKDVVQRRVPLHNKTGQPRPSEGLFCAAIGTGFFLLLGYSSVRKTCFESV